MKFSASTITAFALVALSGVEVRYSCMTVLIAMIDLITVLYALVYYNRLVFRSSLPSITSTLHVVPCLWLLL
jgi:hypothetical protein